MKLNKTLGIFQILILIIGILAFSYMLGEIGKSQGIKVAKGIGIVEAQTSLCGEEGGICLDSTQYDCSPVGGEGGWKTGLCSGSANIKCCLGTYDPKSEGENAQMGPCEKDTDCAEGQICDLDGGDCEEGVDVEYDGGETKVPKSKSGSAGEVLGYLNTFAGTALTIKQLFSIGGKPTLPTGLEGTSSAAATAGSSVSLLSKLFMGKGVTSTGEIATSGASPTAGSMTLNVLGSVAAAIATAAVIYFIFKAAGASPQNLNMLLNAGIVGASVGIAAAFAAWGSSLALFAAATGPVGWVAAAVTAIVMGIWAFFGYQNYIAELITYQISAWQPQEGGTKCDECNKLEFGCTEYQCKTFGQGCGIVNKGTTQERCVWENPDDGEYPVIIEDSEISQLPEAYSYQKSTDLSPPDTGVKITSGLKNCIPPFSSIVLGVKTDEPAQCRISTNREKNFDSMTKDMDEGAIKIEKHTKTLPNSATANDWALNNLVDNSGLPDENNDGVADIEFEITKGNEYEYYIKCKDTNGNENPANFVIKFCVQEKDLTAPAIKSFFIADGSYVQFGTLEVTTEVYTNEPAECKWDFNDKKYDDMQYGMTNCDTIINQATILGNSCTGTFTGLKNGETNKYYVRCQDRSEDKNTNVVSELYTLKVSSQSILINSITVNEKGNNSIIKDAREVIPVDLEIKTSFGAENGKAKCEYEFLGNKIPMSFDYKEINTQTLWLPQGEYTLPISCNDIAGDTDTGSISFKLEKDTDAPVVARAYYDVNNLKIITSEPAECVYTLQSNIGCAYDFADGTAMNEIGELTHYTSWQAGKKYYLKCKDAFGNQPLPGQCSIIVKAFESVK